MLFYEAVLNLTVKYNICDISVKVYWPVYAVKVVNTVVHLGARVSMLSNIDAAPAGGARANDVR